MGSKKWQLPKEVYRVNLTSLTTEETHTFYALSLVCHLTNNMFQRNKPVQSVQVPYTFVCIWGQVLSILSVQVELQWELVPIIDLQHQRCRNIAMVQTYIADILYITIQTIFGSLSISNVDWTSNQIHYQHKYNGNNPAVR